MVMSKTMPITAFKAHVLALLARVSRTGETLVVTKRGKPLAQVGPVKVKGKKKSLEGSVTILGDIMAPINEVWEVERDRR